LQCSLADLRCKEVVNICEGERLGFVDEVLIDTLTGKLVAIVVPGPFKYMGCFGRTDDFIIPWDCITKVGDDLILVEVRGEHKRVKHPKKIWL
jgi:YlmC/YmxH family sporulation protein